MGQFQGGVDMKLQRNNKYARRLTAGLGALVVSLGILTLTVSAGKYVFSSIIQYSKKLTSNLFTLLSIEYYLL